MLSGIEVTAPAKINLTLEILQKRPDGYHEIRTILQTVCLGDALRVDWDVDSTKLFCADPDVPEQEENLVLRGVRLVEQHLGFPVHAHIFLEKKIPVGAGLGGGSSNAAAILQLLGKKFHLPQDLLMLMASKLGADVPFFFTGGTALGKGKGDELEKLPPFPSYPVVIVKPGFSISTRLAYERVTEYSTGENARNAVQALKNKQHEQIFDYLVNDFEKILFPFYPELAEIKETLLECGALAAQLSGSGSAIFGVFRDQKLAEKGAGKARPLGKVLVTKS